MNGRRGIILLAATLVAAACSDTTGVTENSLISHRALWEAAGLSSYQYEYRKQCECPPEALRPVLIEVRAGSVTQVRFLDNLLTAESLLAQGYPTIDDLFDYIDEVSQTNVASLVVTYDSMLGYPTLISVDFRRDTADDEFTVRTSNLEPR
jgi:hypothetical protein